MIFQKIKDMTFIADFVLRILSAHPPQRPMLVRWVGTHPPDPLLLEREGGV